MTEEIENSTAVSVNCPACAAVNELDQHRKIECKKCQKPITGHKYGARGALPAVLAFTVGFTGYGLVDRNFLDAKRYPMELEYAMVNACANGDQNALLREDYETKQEVCLCAVGKTVETVPYSELDERKSELRALLFSKLPECL
ncbi:hypothetical protein [Marinobacter sp. HL-58]|uniref:hypothetical protein n=1 Tax=Marinobacter sp. HL-58 TaxID=1479237 RepID=UPI0004803273|nr:hypothetical protein [Marinobacter sp. HL-58]KPP96783.1 MAG: type I site-specific restriction-modification system membrane protein [Marinobacter sp. HL-58]